MTVSQGSLGGARFTVTLPLATDAEPGAARRIEEPSTRPA
jgi:hypothetical protein